jgi:RNA polymerase sigma-70 factor (ECF subfamily)
LADDAEIMKAVQAGAHGRFEELVRRHQSALFRFAANRLGDRDRALDAVQETLLAAFRGANTFDPARPFKPWLWTIHARSCAKMRSNAAPETAASPADLDRRAGADAETSRRMLADLLSALPTEQADAVRLRYFGGLTFEEIADVQQCPLPTAKSRVRYALEKMEAALRETVGTNDR